MNEKKRKGHDDDADLPSQLYTWEKNINASWENVKEDEEGNIIALSSNSERERIHLLKKARITKSIRRGLIRFLVVALDLSQSAAEKDYRPSRLEVCKSQLQQFFMHFYDQNPISQLSLIVTIDRMAKKISDLSGNPKHHILRLQSLEEVKGLASLQNTLLLTSVMLKHVPNYGSREVLLVYNSLSTCDPGNIYETISLMRSMKIRVNIICLSAEIFICKHICEVTGGMFAVATDQFHLQELLSLLTVPPADLSSAEDPSLNVTDFIFMGFPKRSVDTYPLYSYDGKRPILSTSAYICPRCATRTTDIPTQCMVCSLQLNSSSHLARSFHHLFPVPLFIECTVILRTKLFFAEVYKTASASQQEDPDSSSLKLRLTRTEEHDEDEELPPPPPPPPSPSFVNGRSPSQDSSSPPPPPPLSLTEKAPTATAAAAAGQRTGEESVLLTDNEEYCRCRGCLQSLLKEEKIVFRCPSCHNFYCVDCDIFIHETLHNCPSC